MKIWKKFLALLIAVLLIMSATPAAMATETEETSPTGETTVANSNKYVDYSGLEKQIATINGLNGYDYTTATWKPLQEAVEEGKVALKRKYAQWAVDAALKKIEKCKSALVKMDYTQLEAALRNVYVLIDENPQLHDAWSRMDAAVATAKPLLISGDQAAVDAIVIEINALMEELSQFEVEEVVPEVVVQEVEVEVLPTDDYCNIPMHRTWPVLFMASAAVNVGLLILLVYVLVRKRNTMDDTPLVSYNIDDDMDL